MRRDVRDHRDREREARAAVVAASASANATSASTSGAINSGVGSTSVIVNGGGVGAGAGHAAGTTGGMGGQLGAFALGAVHPGPQPYGRAQAWQERYPQPSTQQAQPLQSSPLSQSQGQYTFQGYPAPAPSQQQQQQERRYEEVGMDVDEEVKEVREVPREVLREKEVKGPRNWEGIVKGWGEKGREEGMDVDAGMDVDVPPVQPPTQPQVQGMNQSHPTYSTPGGRVPYASTARERVARAALRLNTGAVSIGSLGASSSTSATLASGSSSATPATPGSAVGGAQRAYLPVRGYEPHLRTAPLPSMFGGVRRGPISLSGYPGMGGPPLPSSVSNSSFPSMGETQVQRERERSASPAVPGLGLYNTQPQHSQPDLSGRARTPPGPGSVGAEAVGGPPPLPSSMMMMGPTPAPTSSYTPPPPPYAAPLPPSSMASMPSYPPPLPSLPSLPIPPSALQALPRTAPPSPERLLVPLDALTSACFGGGDGFGGYGFGGGGVMRRDPADENALRRLRGMRTTPPGSPGVGVSGVGEL
ncbi:hypothetical protein SCHPADRAFT_228896 [Schizopora paradoxa]|uniref:Uncharacterized protein n=1 Tax=Schizopora paradoxa TaxID=27342 RepID=A0A0H2RWA0_9AGAM|nr:hypothetical protein SCHPADRAFT_228896 [Schizopora paradoxa]